MKILPSLLFAWMLFAVEGLVLFFTTRLKRPGAVLVGMGSALSMVCLTMLLVA